MSHLKPLITDVAEIGAIKCPNCGYEGMAAGGTLCPTYENEADSKAGKDPDYILCTECHTLNDYPFDPGYYL